MDSNAMSNLTAVVHAIDAENLFDRLRCHPVGVSGVKRFTYLVLFVGGHIYYGR